jgi:antitoxin HicB
VIVSRVTREYFKGIAGLRMTQMMGTSRAQLDRLLDPERDVTLSTLARAASMVGRRLRVELA